MHSTYYTIDILSHGIFAALSLFPVKSSEWLSMKPFLGLFSLFASPALSQPLYRGGTRHRNWSMAHWQGAPSTSRPQIVDSIINPSPCRKSALWLYPLLNSASPWKGTTPVVPIHHSWATLNSSPGDISAMGGNWIERLRVDKWQWNSTTCNWNSVFPLWPMDWVFDVLWVF